MKHEKEAQDPACYTDKVLGNQWDNKLEPYFLSIQISYRYWLIANYQAMGFELLLCETQKGSFSSRGMGHSEWLYETHQEAEVTNQFLVLFLLWYFIPKILVSSVYWAVFCTLGKKINEQRLAMCVPFLWKEMGNRQDW